MIECSDLKLGRKHVRKDQRTLKLKKYLHPNLPAPPAEVDWCGNVKEWGMMLNDKLSTCSIAGIAHAIQVWSSHTHEKEITLPDDQIELYYEKWAGYNPEDPANTDNGGVELDILKEWRKGSIDRHKLLGFADPALDDFDEIRQAIHLFGGVYVGINLPLTARDQVVSKTVWDVVPDGGPNAEPGSWSGHCVFVPGYDADGFTCITWGRPMRMTLAFWEKYVDEVHALLGHDWFHSHRAPSGFDLEQLEADLGAVAGG